MAKRYNITGTPSDFQAREDAIRRSWTKRATEKNDRIIGDGYAERQKAATLSRTEPISLELKPAPNMRDLIERGEAVEAIAEKMAFSPEHLEKCRKAAADILANVPAKGPKRGQWIREAYCSYRCTVCHTENDIRSDYCPNCGAKMKEKKNGKTPGDHNEK